MYLRKQAINRHFITELERSVFFNPGTFSLPTNPDFLPVVGFGWGPPNKEASSLVPSSFFYCGRKLYFTFSEWGAADNSSAFGVGGGKKYG